MDSRGPRRKTAQRMGQEKLPRVRVEGGEETQAAACAGRGVGPPTPRKSCRKGPLRPEVWENSGLLRLRGPPSP